MEGGSRTSEDKVCHTCGHVGFSSSIATCSLCKVVSQHTYCMRFVCFEVPEDWRCEECLTMAEGYSNREVQMEPEEITRATGSTSVKQEMLQFSHKNISRKIEAGKVKFMTSEEAITLASGRRPKGNLCVSGHHSDFSDLKSPLISLKTVKPALPSSKVIKYPLIPKKGPALTGVDIPTSNRTTETKHVNMERGTKIAVQVRKTNYDKSKANPLAYKISSCARANDAGCNVLDSRHVDNTRRRTKDKRIENKAALEPQVDCSSLIKETTNASQAIKEERASSKEMEGNALSVDDSDTAVRSISQDMKISSQDLFPPLKLILCSDEKHHHALEACWSGTFQVLDLVPPFHGAVQAHFSCQVSPKVYDISKELPGTLQFKMLPRETVWPKIFNLNPPTKDDIALYFSCDSIRNQEKYAYFVQHIDSHDYALKCCVVNVEMLLFTSTQLQIESQKSCSWIYLWSVFRHLRRKITSNGDEKAISCSNSTPANLMQHKSEIPLVNMGEDNPTEVDMEIDMVGDHPVGRIDVPKKLEDASSGFSKTILSSPLSSCPDKSNDSDLLDYPPGFPIPRYKHSAFEFQEKTTMQRK